MDKEKPVQKDIIALAKKTRYYCDLLVNQCDNWLPEETCPEINKSSDYHRKKNKNQGRYLTVFISLILSVCFSALVFGQDANGSHTISTQTNHRLDSLLALLPTAGNDTTTALLYVSIGQEYEDIGEKEKARKYYLKLKKLSNQIDYHYGYFSYASRYTDILIKDGLYDSIVIISSEALAMATELKDRRQEAVANLNIGNGYNLKGYFEIALNHYFNALKYYELLGDSLAIGHLYDMLQTVYWDLKRYDNAVVYGEKAVAILSQAPKPYLYSFALLNLANTYSDMYPPRIEEAEACLDKALIIAKKNGYVYVEVIAYLNYCEILQQTVRLDKQVEYARLALAMAAKMDDPEIESIAMITLGYTSYRANQYDEAENWISQGLKLALEYDFKSTVRQAYNQLSDLSHARHDYHAALSYKQKADSVDNLITTSEMLRYTEEVKIKYETEKKELEIARQQAVISQQNIFRAVLVGGLIFTVIILFLLWYMLTLRNKRNRMLAEMNTTKDKFFSIISHDLKNPAIAQRNALQLLIDHRGSWDADSLTQYYAELLKSADRQLELLYNLLNWAQVQTGRMPYIPTAFDFSEALYSEIALIRNMTQRKGIKLIVQIPEETIVTGDRNMLSTVVRNLLNNAVKFTSVNGEVSLNISSDNDGYTVTISDTGVGMSEEQLQNLYRIGHRQTKTGTAGEQGSGLGLIVCKELLVKHGSRLQVESTQEKGTRFWFTINQ